MQNNDSPSVGWLQIANHATKAKDESRKVKDAAMETWFKNETGRKIARVHCTVIEDTKAADRVSTTVVDSLGDIWTIYHKDKRISKGNEATKKQVDEELGQ